MSSVTIPTLQAAFVWLQFDWTPIPAFVVIVAGFVSGTLGIGSFYSIMLPFALNQMIGASAEELSSAVQCMVLFGILYCTAFSTHSSVCSNPKPARIP